MARAAGGGKIDAPLRYDQTMIDVAWTGWFGFLVLVLLSHAAGLVLSQCARWSGSASCAGIQSAAGHAMAPFLAGAASIAALYMFPRASHIVHAGAALTLLAVLSIVVARFRVVQPPKAVSQTQVGEKILATFLALWVGALLINALFQPVTANDALEYATVGRILFESRDLASYPAIDPQNTASGFFGPWTHPPLYVALIYTMAVVQGHADSPGLMQLIAPWAALATTRLVFTVGCLQNQRCGYFAALVFLSTPLFFSGADSALIDALPVLGLTLVVATAIGLDPSWRSRPAAIGLVLGFALWSHSQAVLFIPLALAALAMQGGVGKWRATAKNFAQIVIVAALISAWPYLRNMAIFGSPISDNPAVFAMPELNWGEFLRYSRGLDNWLAVLQYGVLKGWFAITAFGWSFWLMSIGAVLFLRHELLGTVRDRIQHGTAGLDAGASALFVCLLVTLCYLCGVLASVALGLDLMIKNERYTLVILPLVAILAAYGVDVIANRCAALLADSTVSMRRKDFLLILLTLSIVILPIQLVYVGWYYKWRDIGDLNPEVATHFDVRERDSKFDTVLATYTGMRASRWMARDVPKDALVLSMRPADMYYANRKMISHLDPRMVPIYREKNPRAALAQMLALGLTHIQMTDYGLPVSYRTALGTVINSPEMASLVHASGGTQIYRLGDSGKRVATQSAITLGDNSWTRWSEPRLPGFAVVTRALGFRGTFSDEIPPSDERSWLPLFNRDFSTFLATGRDFPMVGEYGKAMIPVEAGAEYRLTMSLQGRALVRLWLAQFDREGRLIMETTLRSATRIDEQVISDSGGQNQITRRLIALPTASFIRIGIEHVGHTQLTVKSVVLEKIEQQ